MAYSWAKAWRATRLCFYPVRYQRVSMQEAKLAKEKMHGRLACGRPLVVRLASEKYVKETTQNSIKAGGEPSKTGLAGTASGRISRSGKIAAIKNKLKALEEESYSSKKQKQAEGISCDSKAINHPAKDK